MQISGDADINLNLDNQVVDRNLQLTPMELEFHSGDSVEFQLFKQTENLDEDFEISDGVILPVGSSYDWVRYQVVYDGAEHRALSGRVEYSFGDFWNGSRRELNLDLTLRPRPGLSVQLSSEFNDVTLPVGSFTTKLYRLDARTQFNPWISLTQQRAVRLRERRARMAAALPVDSEAGQRHLLHLDAELAGYGERREVQPARSPRRREDRAGRFGSEVLIRVLSPGSDQSADNTDISALPRIFASAASTGSRSPRSITAAAVTGSLINNHNDSAATGASVTDATLTALNTRGQKRLLGGCLGRSVAGFRVAMVLDSVTRISEYRTSLAGSCNSLINRRLQP